MKKIGIMLSMVLVLTGCMFQSGHDVLVCSKDEGKNHYELRFEATGDVIDTVDLKTESDFIAEIKSGLSQAEIEKEVIKKSELYNQLSGMTYTYQLTEGNLISNLNIVIKNAYRENLRELNLLAEASEEPITLSATLKNFEASGISCVMNP